MEATVDNKINPLENIGANTLFNSCNTQIFANLAIERIFQTEKIIKYARSH